MTAAKADVNVITGWYEGHSRPASVDGSTLQVVPTSALPSTGRSSARRIEIIESAGEPVISEDYSENYQYVNLWNATAGSHAIQVETVDTLGNRTTVDSPLFVREYDAPTWCGLKPYPDPSNWARVRMSVSTRDTGSSIRSIAYFADGQVWDSDYGLVVAPGATYSNTRVTPVLTEGNHIFAVDCVDQQHNIAVLGTTPCTWRPVRHHGGRRRQSPQHPNIQHGQQFRDGVVHLPDL